MNNEEYLPLYELNWEKLTEWFNRTQEKQRNNTEWVLVNEPNWGQIPESGNKWQTESLTQYFINQLKEDEMATLEKRVKRLEDKVFGVQPKVMFVKRNHLELPDRNVIGFPHAQVWWNQASQDYNLYIRRQVTPGANNWESLTGNKMANLTLAPSSLPAYSTVINSPKGLYATKHTWYGNPMKPYGQFYKYNNLNGRWDFLKQDTEPSGEDRGVFWCQEWNEFIMYCRRNPYTDRKLAVYRSSDFINWSEYAYNFEPADILLNERFYSAGGFILGDRLYVISNVIDYSDWTVSPMIHIANSGGLFNRAVPGMFNSYQLNEFFSEIDDLHIKQLFVYPHVVNGRVVFTCIKCLEPHESPNGPTGIHWTEVWDMPINDFLGKVKS
jgi:hypothetical protein